MATSCCLPPMMAGAGARVAADDGLEEGTVAGWAAGPKGGGTGVDADLARVVVGWLGDESEDSFESETLRSDRISTVNGVFALFLPSGC